MEKLQRTQRNVEEVRVIMSDNLNKVQIERREKLEDLDERAAALESTAKQFWKTTNTLKEQKQKENKSKSCSRYKLYALVSALAVIIIIVVVVMLFKTQSS